MSLQDFVESQQKFKSAAQASQYKLAYDKGVADTMRMRELQMVKHTEQPTVTGGKVNRLKKAQKWTQFSSDLVDTGIEKLHKLSGGKVNRLKKAKRWTEFASDVFDKGVEKTGMIQGAGVNRLKKAKRWTEFASDVFDKGVEKKNAIGGSRPPNPWILHVKAYAKQHGLSYKDAMSKSRPSYKK